VNNIPDVKSGGYSQLILFTKHRQAGKQRDR